MRAPAGPDCGLAGGLHPGRADAVVRLGPPVGHQFPEIREIGPVAPAGAGDLVGPARAPETGAEIGQHLVGDADREGARRHRLTPRTTTAGRRRGWGLRAASARDAPGWRRR